MKDLNTGKDDMDLGFEVHQKGSYLFQVQSGIEFKSEETNAKETLSITCKSLKVIDGSADGVGGSVIHFMTLITKDGEDNKMAEKQVASILTITGLAAAFESKFPDGTKYTDPKFIAGIKLKLKGKIFGAEVEHETYKERTNARLKKWWKMSGDQVPANPPKEAAKEETIPTSQTQEAGGDNATAGDDW